jgi:K+-sensing histidine kinase KdpD
MADWQDRVTLEEALALLQLADSVVRAENLQDLAGAALPGLASLANIPAALLYLKDQRQLYHFFFQTGFPGEAVPALENLCAHQMRQLPAKAGFHTLAVSLPGQANHLLHLIPLLTPKECLGLLGLVASDHETPPSLRLVEKFLPFLNQPISNLLDRLEYQKRLAHLNTYLSVSSLIAQALDLRDTLEAILYFSMEAVGAEAASVLLLDYEKKNFRFYNVQGPAKPVLLMATFPADQGLAGFVLRSQQSEVIHDVQTDPRFYPRFDKECGFHTRNMISLPLTAGEERVGVLEVINKTGGEPFTEEERLLLQSIAEEMAFAIRNAKLFEVVVKSYCKQRQGLNTCEGCKRPLASWTPCVKYRQDSMEV